MKSPNYMSREGWKPDMIVLHVCEGTFEGSKSWLCNPASGASAHFVSGINGELEQLVDLDKAAWCNGTSIKPEFSSYYGNSTLQAVRNRKTNANYYTISIENEGYSYKGLYGDLTEKQYATVLKLCKELITKYPAIKIDREHIVGHYQITPISKPNCPGKNFPFDRLITDLKTWEEAKKMLEKFIDKYSAEVVDRGLDKLFQSEAKKDEPSSWAKEELAEAVKKGITDGTRPQDMATRQEVAIMVNRATKTTHKD